MLARLPYVCSRTKTSRVRQATRDHLLQDYQGNKTVSIRPNWLLCGSTFRSKNHAYFTAVDTYHRKTKKKRHGYSQKSGVYGKPLLAGSTAWPGTGWFKLNHWKLFPVESPHHVVESDSGILHVFYNPSRRSDLNVFFPFLGCMIFVT